MEARKLFDIKTDACAELAGVNKLFSESLDIAKKFAYENDYEVDIDDIKTVIDYLDESIEKLNKAGEWFHNGIYTDDSFLWAFSLENYNFINELYEYVDILRYDVNDKGGPINAALKFAGNYEKLNGDLNTAFYLIATLTEYVRKVDEND